MSMKKKAAGLLAALLMCSSAAVNAVPAYAASAPAGSSYAMSAVSETRTPFSLVRLNTLIQDKTVVGFKSKVSMNAVNNHYDFRAANGTHLEVNGIQVMVYDCRTNPSFSWTTPKSGAVGSTENGYCSFADKNCKNVTFGGVNLWGSRCYAYKSRYFKLALAPVRYDAKKKAMRFAKTAYYTEPVWYDIVTNQIVADPTR